MKRILIAALGLLLLVGCSTQPETKKVVEPDIQYSCYFDLSGPMGTIDNPNDVPIYVHFFWEPTYTRPELLQAMPYRQDIYFKLLPHESAQVRGSSDLMDKLTTNHASIANCNDGSTWTEHPYDSDDNGKPIQWLAADQVKDQK